MSYINMEPLRHIRVIRQAIDRGYRSLFDKWILRIAQNPLSRNHGGDLVSTESAGNCLRAEIVEYLANYSANQYLANIITPWLPN